MQHAMREWIRPVRQGPFAASLILALTLSLTHSLSLTYTHTHKHIRAHTETHHTHDHSHCSPSHTRAQVSSHARTYSLILFFSHPHIPTHTRTHNCPSPHPVAHPLTLAFWQKWLTGPVFLLGPGFLGQKPSSSSPPLLLGDPSPSPPSSSPSSPPLPSPSPSRPVRLSLPSSCPPISPDPSILSPPPSPSMPSSSSSPQSPLAPRDPSKLSREAREKREEVAKPPLPPLSLPLSPPLSPPTGAPSPPLACSCASRPACSSTVLTPPPSMLFPAPVAPSAVVTALSRLSALPPRTDPPAPVAAAAVPIEPDFCPSASPPVVTPVRGTPTPPCSMLARRISQPGPPRGGCNPCDAPEAACACWAAILASRLWKERG